MGSSKKHIWLLLGAVLAASLLSTVSLLDFYVSNADKIAGPKRVIRYAGITLLMVVFVAAFVKICWMRIRLWRVVLAVGIGAFVFFSYYRLAPLRTTLLAGWQDWFPLLWILASLVAAMVALVFIRRPSAVSIILVLSFAFSAPSIARAVALAIQKKEAPAPSAEQSIGVSRALITPNIYWIVLDAYPRRDVLRESFGFDNDHFLNSLTSMGFTVLGQSLSNFPATINSVSSTLNMDYTIRPDGDGVSPFAARDLYRIVKGGSRTVSVLKGLGSLRTFRVNGYDHLTKCAEDERRCVSGQKTGWTQDIAILSNTPIIHLITQFEATSTETKYLSHVGGISDLSAKLNVIQETPVPFFLYAHIIAPFIRRIRFVPIANRRTRISSCKVRSDFVEQLKCVNAQAGALLRQINKSDPNAIVILQSDHKPHSMGSSKRRRQIGRMRTCGNNSACSMRCVCRYPVVTASWRISPWWILSLLVLSCLTGSEFKRHPSRLFVTPYDNSAEYGRAVEYSSNRLSGHPTAR